MSRCFFVSALLLVSYGVSPMLLAQSLAAPAFAQSSAQPSAQQAARPNDRNCIRDTGSRIPVKKGRCLPVTGRSYSQQDLLRTGRPNLGEALQQLDPRITVHGH